MSFTVSRLDAAETLNQQISRLSPLIFECIRETSRATFHTHCLSSCCCGVWRERGPFVGASRRWPTGYCVCIDCCSRVNLVCWQMIFKLWCLCSKRNTQFTGGDGCSCLDALCPVATLKRVVGSRRKRLWTKNTRQSSIPFCPM